ncbi:Plasmodium exported protein, unknown function [Plasmodium relictum]|uniref:Plasmodium RESA N-terminal domain-containing protein n=1 Tax=Plasmodium relictum TaxID=85471 RepID=A0A1J1GJX3_PLARL|nr:Plasmodium exported protein, unknown function [Plasmodium relictum]CRG84217.1 Plasmodium exported protein, unknown function [Plasmodium relictum]
MIYFIRSNGDLRKYILDSNSIITKSYPTNSYINKGKTAKKKINMIPICLKLFTVLFLGLSCFFLECLFKKENMQISILKFNKDHLRTLAEKESEIINKLEYMNGPYNKFEEDFKKITVSLIRNVLENWEDMCYINNVRLSIYGRKWEQEKFDYLFSEILKDIKDIHRKIFEEYKEYEKSYHTDKEYSTFFKKKKKDLNQFEKMQYKWTNKYEERCRKEWEYLESSRDLEKLRNEQKSCNLGKSCNQDSPRNLESLNNPKTCPLKKLFQKNEYRRSRSIM